MPKSFIGSGPGVQLGSLNSVRQPEIIEDHFQDVFFSFFLFFSLPSIIWANLSRCSCHSHSFGFGFGFGFGILFDTQKMLQIMIRFFSVTSLSGSLEVVELLAKSRFKMELQADVNGSFTFIFI